jgi:RNA recognition motif-containing protein
LPNACFPDSFQEDYQFENSRNSSSYHDSRGDGGSFRGGRDRAPHRERKPISAPSQSVIFLGLPAHVDDGALRIFLESMGASIDSTTIIMDKVTGQSKRFGFAKFGSVEHARSFVEPNFPFIQWRDDVTDSSGEKFRVKIDYSQNLEKPNMAQPGGMGSKGGSKFWQHDRAGGDGK